MAIFEIIDEKNRFNGIKYTIEPFKQVYQTHTFSYLEARKMFIEMGETMGLEAEVYKND